MSRTVHRAVWTVRYDALGNAAGTAATVLGRLAIGVDRLRRSIGVQGDTLLEVCNCAAVRVVGLRGEIPSEWSNSHCDVGVGGPVERRLRLRPRR